MTGMTKQISRWTVTTFSLMALVAGVSGQSPQKPPSQTTSPAPPQTSNPQNQNPAIFRATANSVYNDIKVVNDKGDFDPTLSIGDFKVFEDGVEQKIDFFQPVVGGRFMSPVTVAAPHVNNGIIMPAARPPVDTTGRIIVVFIDDLHLQTADTPIAKNVLRIMRDNLLHDGDQITIVGTGYSGIDGYNLMYYYKRSHARLDEAIDKVYGSGMSPEEIINASQTESGPAGLRYNMDTAFRTAYDVLDQLEHFTNRRKAFIYLSSGYDLDPFKDSRLQAAQNGYDHTNAPGNSFLDSLPTTPGATSNPLSANGYATNPYASQIGEFSESDLFREMAELIRAAKRADTVFYTCDPRGLMSALAPGMTNLTPGEWMDYMNTSTSTLRALAEQTGGIAGVNTNDFSGFFKRVDADFSDYYEIGYTSSDVDPTHRTRKIEIKTTRPGLRVIQQRDTYSLKLQGDVVEKPKPAKPKRGGGGGGQPRP